MGNYKKIDKDDILYIKNTIQDDERVLVGENINEEYSHDELSGTSSYPDVVVKAKSVSYTHLKKQGSASNGEKQTPYFIILAASLLQCYPANTCCARLAFIDEAFSALSRERIEQMVRYFEENHFQVFYAAPPEKINSIGPVSYTHLDSERVRKTGYPDRGPHFCRIGPGGDRSGVEKGG